MLVHRFSEDPVYQSYSEKLEEQERLKTRIENGDLSAEKEEELKEELSSVMREVEVAREQLRSKV
ncbi:MAG: hypothetical protein ACQEP3_01725 [Patescibacteria group bacterium]